MDKSGFFFLEQALVSFFQNVISYPLSSIPTFLFKKNNIRSDSMESNLIEFHTKDFEVGTRRRTYHSYEWFISLFEASWKYVRSFE